MVDTSILPADALAPFKCPRHDCEMDRMRIAELERKISHMPYGSGRRWKPLAGPTPTKGV